MSFYGQEKTEWTYKYVEFIGRSQGFIPDLGALTGVWWGGWELGGVCHCHPCLARALLNVRSPSVNWTTNKISQVMLMKLQNFCVWEIQSILHFCTVSIQHSQQSRLQSVIYLLSVWTARTNRQPPRLWNGTSLGLTPPRFEAFLLKYFISYVKTKVHRRLVYVDLKKQCSTSLEPTQDANIHFQK